MSNPSGSVSAAGAERAGTPRWVATLGWIGVTACAAVLLALKYLAVSRWRMDPDEAQHLHVIWGWTQGLVQYRDLFDNHPPLFHIIMEPVLRLFPERADIVVPMRLIMIPVSIAGLWAIFDAGRSLYSARAGAWLALIAGALPWVFFPAVEFRPEVLYAALMAWTVAMIAEGRMTRMRVAAIGLLLGVCAALSLKIAPAIAALAFAAATLLALQPRASRIGAGETILRVVICIAAGLIFPELICYFFYRHGAIPVLLFCLFDYNMVPADAWRSGPILHWFYLPVALPFLFAAARWILKQGPTPEAASRRAVIFLFTFLYLILLAGYWPVVAAADFLPCFLLLPLALMPFLVAAARRIPRPTGLVPPALFILLAALICFSHQRGNLAADVRRTSVVLRLTDPGDKVMDRNGESIYRARAFYYPIDAISENGFRLGWMRDSIVPDMTAAHVAVCVDPPYPGDAADFVANNFLPLAFEPRIFVPGQTRTATSVFGVLRFDAVVPGDYVFLRAGAQIGGILDGTTASAGPVKLTPGQHTFSAVRGTGAVTLFWARAWLLGFRPVE